MVKRREDHLYREGKRDGEETHAEHSEVQKPGSAKRTGIFLAARLAAKARVHRAAIAALIANALARARITLIVVIGSGRALIWLTGQKSPVHLYSRQRRREAINHGVPSPLSRTAFRHVRALGQATRRASWVAA
ncbi:MAG: hypothetical protein M3Z19_13070, partial [Chloroflexota bacterium]|nr:hypothetical protein [Chloroflexota bacterium]